MTAGKIASRTAAELTVQAVQYCMQHHRALTHYN